MRVDIGKKSVDLRNKVRVCGGGWLLKKGGEIIVRINEDLDKRIISERRLMRKMEDEGVIRKRYDEGLRRKIESNKEKKGWFEGEVEEEKECIR